MLLYQALAEPTSQEAEAVTVDRWDGGAERVPAFLTRPRGSLLYRLGGAPTEGFEEGGAPPEVPPVYFGSPGDQTLPGVILTGPGLTQGHEAGNVFPTPQDAEAVTVDRWVPEPKPPERQRRTLPPLEALSFGANPDDFTEPTAPELSWGPILPPLVVLRPRTMPLGIWTTSWSAAVLQGLTRTRKPYLQRVPAPNDANFERRHVAAHDLLSSFFNSLVRQGIIVQTGPDEWTIVPPE